MRKVLPVSFALAVLSWFTTTVPQVLAQTPPPRPIPEPLRPWVGWATWDEVHRDCPTPYSDSKKHFCFWPSLFSLQADKNGGRFELAVTVFHETWVPLPGGAETWPQDVTSNESPVAVVEHDGQPAVKLAAGAQRITGAYRWSEIPQRIQVPQTIGILALTLEGQKVDAPVWDAQGLLWLKRDGAADEADKNFLDVKFYAAL